MKIVLTVVAVFFIFLVGILPFRILYIFSDLTRFFLQKVFKYRMKVIRGNLERCFPEKSNKEIDQLVAGAYKNLTDITVEGFKAFTMSNNQIVKRHKVLNAEILETPDVQEKSFITTPCHYGNWEWGAMSPALQFPMQIIAFYTPLSNPYLNNFIKKNRSRAGTLLAPTNETSKTFDDFSKKQALYIMAADQSPSKAEKAIWIDFLGQQTAFFDGPERHARKRDIPVVFVDIQRIKRGYYELELSYISKKPTETKPGEITAIFAKKLEKAILNQPENWLWSHKRWKLNKN